MGVVGGGRLQRLQFALNRLLLFAEFRHPTEKLLQDWKGQAWVETRGARSAGPLAAGYEFESRPDTTQGVGTDWNLGPAALGVIANCGIFIAASVGRSSGRGDLRGKGRTCLSSRGVKA